MKNHKRLILLGWFLAASVAAQELPVIDPDRKEADPLFSSHDLLEVTITVPVERLMDERPLEEEFPGTISYVDQSGATVAVDIEIRTRGRYRRQERICPFPPTRIDFKKKQTDGTVFDKQDKLKLVGHCRHGGRYEQLVLKEYLAYRFFNELTDNSFRVRLLRINWVDSDDPEQLANPKEEGSTYYGFFIEHRDRMAKRIGREPLKIPRTSVAELEPEYTNLTSVFQYFIANTDFSPILGAADDFCCHNTNLFGRRGELLWSIPYDFDMAGMVDAPYATPNEKFRIRSVRQRLYRGRCVNNEYLPQTLDLFREKKAAFYALVENQQDLSNSSRKSMLSLMDRFYDLIDDERAVKKRIADACI
ncbi:MAG: hypothetical protein R3358_00930 [Woeseiaceae bacterium]|nr:hypothetical protein [Woeseiaceae bacterium]